MAEHSSARSLQDFNEEAFQATLRSAGNKGLQIINEMNPIKAREIFNSYSQINEQIDNTGQYIKHIVNETEKDFLSAFEQKMYIVQRDMRDLK